MLRRVVLNSASLLGGQVIVKALGLAWLAIVARHLGGDRFGYLMYALSLASLVGILVEAGLSPVLTRGVARSPEEAPRFLSNVLSLRLVLSAASIPLTILVSLYTGATTKTIVPICIASASTAAAGLYAISNSIFFGRERMEVPSAIMVGSKLVSLAAGLWAVHEGAGVVLIAFVFLLEPLIGLAASVPLLWRVLGLRFVPGRDVPFCRGMVRESIPFALALVMSLAYCKIDVVMLSAMKGSEPVGWYSAAYRLLDGLVYLPAAFINTVFPTMARLKLESPVQLRTIVARSWEVIIGMALPIALVLALSSDRIVLFLYGEAYAETIPVLQLIGASLFFVFVNNFLGMLLGAVDRQRVNVICSMGGVALNVVLNLILIPGRAHMGAAAATLITQVVLVIPLGWAAVRFTGAGPSMRRVLKLAAAGALLAAVLLLGRNLNLAVLLLLGTFSYAAGLVMTRVVTPEERRQVFAAFVPERRRDPAGKAGER